MIHLSYYAGHVALITFMPGNPFLPVGIKAEKATYRNDMGQSTLIPSQALILGSEIWVMKMLLKEKGNSLVFV